MTEPSRDLANEPIVADAPERERYEATVGGELAGFLEYMLRRQRIALVHTEVLPAFEGRGVAARLVRWALDDARARGLGVIATCPYVRSYLERHPEEADVVVGRYQPGGLTRGAGGGSVGAPDVDPE